MEEIERSAASVEEAIELALEELGVSEQEARILIVQEPRGGFLGMGSQPAVVRVSTLSARAGDDRGPAARGGDEEPRESGSDPLLDEQADVGADFLDGLLAAIGLDADVEINDVDGVTYLDVWGAENADDMGLLIGKGGHTIEALQEILRGHVHRATGERCRVMVDVEDYRKRRRAHVLRKARDVARDVQRSGRPQALEPMGAYERKLVHDAVSEFPGLVTASEGEEPDRRVVIRRAGASA